MIFNQPPPKLLINCNMHYLNCRESRNINYYNHQYHLFFFSCIYALPFNELINFKQFSVLKIYQVYLGEDKVVIIWY